MPANALNNKQKNLKWYYWPMFMLPSNHVNHVNDSQSVVNDGSASSKIQGYSQCYQYNCIQLNLCKKSSTCMFKSCKVWYAKKFIQLFGTFIRVT